MKYCHIMFIIVFSLGIVIGRQDFFFFRTRFTSFHTRASLLIFFVGFFILFHSCCIPMRKCLGKHSCVSSPFPLAILNGTLFSRSVKSIDNWKWSSIWKNLLKLGARKLGYYPIKKFTIFPDTKLRSEMSSATTNKDPLYSLAGGKHRSLWWRPPGGGRSRWGHLRRARPHGHVESGRQVKTARDRQAVETSQNEL